MVALCGMPTIQYSARSRSTRFFKLNDLHISTSLFFVMTDMSRDSIVDRHCLRLRMCRMPSTRVRRRRKFGEVSWTECTGQGNDFEWIPTVKMETAQPMEGSFGNEYQSIYNHCGVMTPEVAERWKNVDFCLFWKKTLYWKIFKIMLLCSERIYRDTDRRVVFKFCEIWLTEIGKVKCVHGASSKVNPIYGWSLASSRRNSDSVYTGFAVNVCCEELSTDSWLSCLFRFGFGAAAHKHRFTCKMSHLIPHLRSAFSCSRASVVDRHTH